MRKEEDGEKRELEWLTTKPPRYLDLLNNFCANASQCHTGKEL